MVLDGSKPLDEEDDALLTMAKSKQHLVVVNKKDLQVVVQLQGAIYVSSLYKEVATLKQAMVQLLGVDLPMYPNRALMSNTRQIGLLKQMQSHLQQVVAACQALLPIDILAIDVKAALYCIQDLLGEVAKADLDEVIFSRFCLGK